MHIIVKEAFGKFTCEKSFLLLYISRQAIARRSEAYSSPALLVDGTKAKSEAEADAPSLAVSKKTKNKKPVA